MYHLKEDGLPGPCDASVRSCPRGGADEHYKTKLEALMAAEKKLASENQEYLDSAKEAKVFFHVNESGAVEECPFRPGKCTVKPFGNMDNQHTTDQDDAESFAKFLREKSGKAEVASAPRATERAETPPTRKQRATSTTRAARTIAGGDTCGWGGGGRRSGPTC